MENAGTNYGVGFIPTLEITGAQDPTKITFPSSHALNTELCALLAMTEPANAVEMVEARADFPPHRASPQGLRGDTQNIWSLARQGCGYYYLIGEMRIWM